jgi:hypothetical protein
MMVAKGDNEFLKQRNPESLPRLNPESLPESLPRLGHLAQVHWNPPLPFQRGTVSRPSANQVIHTCNVHLITPFSGGIQLHLKGSRLPKVDHVTQADSLLALWTGPEGRVATPVNPAPRAVAARQNQFC